MGKRMSKAGNRPPATGAPSPPCRAGRRVICFHRTGGNSARKTSGSLVNNPMDSRAGALLVTRNSDEPDELFVELRRTHDAELRSALIERHLPLARSLAARYRYTPQPLEDLVQVASLALVKAVDAFDPERGTSFVAFAVPTIVGELKRSMRSSAWALHMPRSLQEQVAAVSRAERVLSARGGGIAPTVQELAAEAQLSVEAVLEAFAARNAQDATSIESVASDPADAGHLDELEQRLALDDAIAGLSRREQEILRLRFLEGLTQTAIGERLGLAQFQVSRILRASLDELRSQLER
jgi:RNA polymerase sigma-B factor